MNFTQKWQKDDNWREMVINNCEKAGKVSKLSSDLMQICRWKQGSLFDCPKCPFEKEA